MASDQAEDGFPAGIGPAGRRAWLAFLAFVFLSMVSLPFARIALVVAIALALVARRGTGAGRLRLAPPTVGWLVYLAVALVVSAVAAACLDDPLLVPAKGLRKVTKLLWFAGIPLAAATVTYEARLRKTLSVLVAGGVATALVILVVNTSIAWLQVHYPTEQAAADATGFAALLHSAASAIGLDPALQHALDSDVWRPWGGRPPSFYYAFTSLGTMHDAQRLMVALIASLFLLDDARRRRGGAPRAVLCSLLLAVGLILTCKRGPILIGFATCFALALRRAGLRRALVLLLCAALAIAAVPQVRARMADLPAEFSVKSGGRALMWMKIVPALHREHPWGIGFRSLTAAKMAGIDRRIEPNRTHVHSTPLEAFVDFGWLGVAAWLLWTYLVFRSALRLARSGGAIAAAPFCLLLSLALFGLVEYNLADASVVVFYGTIMGLGTSCQT